MSSCVGLKCSPPASGFFVISSSFIPSCGCNRMISLFGDISPASRPNTLNGLLRNCTTISLIFCGNRFPDRR